MRAWAQAWDESGATLTFTSIPRANRAGVLSIGSLAFRLPPAPPPPSPAPFAGFGAVATPPPPAMEVGSNTGLQRERGVVSGAGPVLFGYSAGTGRLGLSYELGLWRQQVSSTPRPQQLQFPHVGMRTAVCKHSCYIPRMSLSLSLFSLPLSSIFSLPWNLPAAAVNSLRVVGAGAERAGAERVGTGQRGVRPRLAVARRRPHYHAGRVRDVPNGVDEISAAPWHIRAGRVVAEAAERLLYASCYALRCRCPRCAAGRNAVAAACATG